MFVQLNNLLKFPKGRYSKKNCITNFSKSTTDKNSPKSSVYSITNTTRLRI